MINRIVAALDGSPHSKRAIETASDMARQLGAKLFLVHAVGTGPLPPALVHMAEVEHLTHVQRPETAGNVANIFGNLARAQTTAEYPAVSREVHQAVGEKILKEGAALARKKGVSPVDVVLQEGDAAKAILQAAKDVQADLIVLGTRGLSEIKGLLLGSVSHKVLQLSTCACLIVK